MYGILSFSLSTQNMMAFCSGSTCTQARVPFMINHLRSSPAFTACRLRKNHMFHHHQSMIIDTLSKVMVRTEAEQCNNSHKSFLQGSRNCIVRGGSNTICRKRSSVVHASWMPSSDIASNAFTFGTLSVLPFYTLMVLAPRADFTKNLLASSVPYVVLGLLYGYLLHLSWTSDTACLIFATKYLLPLLSTISKLFSREMSVASAWIHLLAVDLYAARQVYFDGLQENIETRHSVLICLFFCPLGILTHFITKSLTRSREDSDKETNL